MLAKGTIHKNTMELIIIVVPIYLVSVKQAPNNILWQQTLFLC